MKVPKAYRQLLIFDFVEKQDKRPPLATGDFTDAVRYIGTKSDPRTNSPTMSPLVTRRRDFYALLPTPTLKLHPNSPPSLSAMFTEYMALSRCSFSFGRVVFEYRRTNPYTVSREWLCHKSFCNHVEDFNLESFAATGSAAKAGNRRDEMRLRSRGEALRLRL